MNKTLLSACLAMGMATSTAAYANFSARMPYTYPKFHGAFSTYDSKPCENVATMEGAYNYDARTDVLYSFGQGLSYTTVKYDNLTCSMQDDNITFTIDVENVGDRAVKEPVLLFVSDLVATLTPDVKRLRAFEKVDLDAHERKTVTLSIKKSDLAYVNTDLKWIVEPGEFKAAIAGQSVLFEIK